MFTDWRLVFIDWRKRKRKKEIEKERGGGRSKEGNKRKATDYENIR